MPEDIRMPRRAVLQIAAGVARLGTVGEPLALSATRSSPGAQRRPRRLPASTTARAGFLPAPTLPSTW